MTEIGYILAGILAGIVIGWLMGIINQKGKSDREILDLNRQLSKAGSDVIHAQTFVEQLNRQLTESKDKLEKKQLDLEEQTRNAIELEAANHLLTDKLDTQKNELTKLHETLKLEFQNVANAIFDEKTTRFNELSSEKLSNLLNPLNNNLKEFKDRVNEVYDKEAKERFSLTREITNLMDLNRKISEEANNLTLALKGDSKAQGNWGEMILENILEASGLREGEEYFVQETLRSPEGEKVAHEATGKSMRPDIIVRYPGDRDVIIDSKVSLTAYSQFVATDDPREKELFGKEHLRSVKAHIDELNKKDYSSYTIRSLEFVMMFIPNEPSYNMALQAEPTLWEYAYAKKVVLISPTNLIAALRMAMELWKREYQVRNIQEIVRQGSALYDKFVGFSSTFEKIGTELNAARKLYDEAFGQLSTGKGNLVQRVENLRKLGLSPSKKLSHTYLNTLTETSGENEPDEDGPEGPISEKQLRTSNIQLTNQS